jgi:ATP-dependent DNA helicase RecQ
MRDQSVWHGCLSPKAYLDSQAFADVRHYTASHRWSMSVPVQPLEPPVGARKVVIEVALAWLQRGAWTTCSWSLEQQLAQQWQDAGFAELNALPQERGLLGYDLVLTKQGKKDLGVALICGWLPSEACEVADTPLWDQLCSTVPLGQIGSIAEQTFFEQVLVPVLDFPLLHYLRVQTSLSELIDRADRFVRQRVDFSIETGRGLKMVIEVDSGQFHPPNSPQGILDKQRTKTLETAGWIVWRPMATDIFKSPQRLIARLREYLQPHTWGLEYSDHVPRSLEIMNSVWGATVVARVQFLLLR